MIWAGKAERGEVTFPLSTSLGGDFQTEQFSLNFLKGGEEHPELDCVDLCLVSRKSVHGFHSPTTLLSYFCGLHSQNKGFSVVTFNFTEVEGGYFRFHLCFLPLDKQS